MLVWSNQPQVPCFWEEHIPFAVSAGPGSWRRLTALEARLNAHRDVRPASAILSPDKKWVLMELKEPHMMNGGYEGRVAVSVDGSSSSVHVPETDLDYNGDLAWEPDSSGWLSLNGGSVFNRAATRYRLIRQARGSRQNCPSSRKYFNGDGTKRPATTGCASLVGTTTDEACSYRGNSRSGGRSRSFAIDVRGSGLPMSKTVASVPGNLRVDQACVSPQGDQIAWLMFRAAPNRANRKPRLEIWLSDITGAGLQLLGYANVKPLPKDYVLEDNFVTDLRWLPDRRHLSFIRLRSIWTVPVP